MYPTYTDIDECVSATTNLCQQQCINTDGSYFCACYDGYQLIEGTNQCEGIPLPHDIVELRIPVYNIIIIMQISMNVMT